VTLRKKSVVEQATEPSRFLHTVQYGTRTAPNPVIAGVRLQRQLEAAGLVNRVSPPKNWAPRLVTMDARLRALLPTGTAPLFAPAKAATNFVYFCNNSGKKTVSCTWVAGEYAFLE